MSDTLTASEALFGFTAWLTTRSEPVTFSAKHDASVVAELVRQFCDTNNFAEPRDCWTDSLKHPKKGIAKTTSLQNMAKSAWGIIANAGGGDWDTQTPDWRLAAERWRDEYHATLPNIGDAEAPKQRAEIRQRCDKARPGLCLGDKLTSDEALIIGRDIPLLLDDVERLEGVVEKLLEFTSWRKGVGRIPTKKPGHGNCCTCQDCGHYHDECVCEHNEIEDILEATP